MKITLKTDPETLFLLQKIINNECQMVATDIGRKTGKSMRIELFTLLTQRCFSYSQNPNGKKLQLTLKYHLAALVLEILINSTKDRMGIYEANKLEMFKNDLHKLL